MTAHAFLNTEPWVEQAACGGNVNPAHDPEIHFPIIGPPFTPARHNDAIDRAKEVCADCPVTVECLTYALEQDERFGVWGGRDENERRAIKRRMGHR